ncbi:hypothetical protein IMZ48_23850, partial [Candidatus Bathyarchaeota archaeon]|nr:hypothetical protein [Candidatus Bathyarchaeota archaeon]
RLALGAKNDAYEELELARVAKGMATEDRDKKSENATSLEEQALKAAGERVHIAENETHSSIEAKYEKLQAQLRSLEKRLGASEEEITERAEQAHQTYDQANTSYKAQLDIQDQLKLALEGRLKKWRVFQRFLSARTRVNFNYLLSERGFRGRMLIDHRSRRLALNVEPDETRKGGGGRETKSLSGGEKSFSSICMLLAIWEAMGSSIRCLDEFDVFMDNINRAISTNMLVSSVLPRTVLLLITDTFLDLRRAQVGGKAVHSHHAERDRGARKPREGCQDYPVRCSIPPPTQCSSWRA